MTKAPTKYCRAQSITNMAYKYLLSIGSALVAVALDRVVLVEEPV